MLAGIWKRGLVFVLSVSLLYGVVYAYPSGGSFPPKFEFINGYWYDSWQINRNAAWGKNGYLPNIMYEAIDTAADQAYGWGMEFKQAFSKRVTRAGAILSFVQSWTAYGLDEEYVSIEGKPQPEWAWNADEMAYMMKKVFESKGIVRGDCEDLTILCATIYLGAGFDIALVHAHSHIAFMIWLPDYPDANIYWDLEDGRGKGWVWIETTGKRNPLGWTPPDFRDGKFDTHIFRSRLSEYLYVNDVVHSPAEPDPVTNVKVTASVNHTYKEIINVTLGYSVDLGPEKRVAMSKVTSMIYEGIIPPQREGSSVEYYIQAYVKGGETVRSGKLSYGVESKILGMSAKTFYLASLLTAILAAVSVVIKWRNVRRRLRP